MVGILVNVNFLLARQILVFSLNLNVNYTGVFYNFCLIKNVNILIINLVKTFQVSSFESVALIQNVTSLMISC